jgi:negative regulator of sigma E activity
MSFSDEDLTAYVDGELDDEKRQQVQDAIHRDPEIARRVASHQALRDTLRKGFEPVLQEPVPERLLTAARSASAVSKSNVVPFRDHRVPVRPRPRWIALAASFILGALALQFGASLLKSDSITERNGQMLAAGILREALSNQLTASQTPQTPVQIGVSFLSHGGNYCRTFQFRDLGGLACNEAGSWKLEVLARENHTGNSEYRPAATNLPPAVVQAVTDTISGEPLDAREETSARAQKWQK